MKKLLLVLLLLPLLAYPQAEKRHRSIIIDSVKALNGGIIDIKDSVSFEKPVGIGGVLDASALLTLTDTTQGILIPRLTTVQRDAISSPTIGLSIFNTTTNQLEYFANILGWLGVGITGGDMLKSVYDANDDAIVNNSDSLNSNPAAYYVDTATAQNIRGEKTFRDTIFPEKPIKFNSAISTKFIDDVNSLAELLIGEFEAGDITLSVDGNAFASGGLLYLSKATSAAGLWVDGNEIVAARPSVITLTRGGQAVFNGGALSTQVQFDATALISLNSDNTIDILVDKVGIGTVTPSEQLDVDGNVKGDTAKFAHYGGLSDFTIGLPGEDITISADTITGNPVWDSITAGQLTLNGISLDSAIPASSFTGNLANSTTPADTIFADVVISNAINIFTVSDTIDSTAIANLNSTPIEIVATPGSGKAIEVINVSTQILFNSVAWDTNTDLLFTTNTANQEQFKDVRILASTVSRITSGFQFPVINTTDTQLIPNQPLTVSVKTGNPANGDSDIIYYVTYRIITL